jgi:hypothetical protein
MNNSCVPLELGRANGMLGVLHKGQVTSAPPGATRNVNTLMMAPAPIRHDDVLRLDALRAYIESGTFTAE